MNNWCQKNKTYPWQALIFDHAAFTVTSSFLVSVLLSTVCSFFTCRSFNTSIPDGSPWPNKKNKTSLWISLIHKAARWFITLANRLAVIFRNKCKKENAFVLFFLQDPSIITSSQKHTNSTAVECKANEPRLWKYNIQIIARQSRGDSVKTQSFSNPTVFTWI